MPMLKIVNWFLLFVLFVFLSCQDSSVEQPKKPIGNYFNLPNKATLFLPSSMQKLAAVQTKDSLSFKVYASFRKRLGKKVISSVSFRDSLSTNHLLVAYQVQHETYNQNMASLLNNSLIIHINTFDEQLACHQIQNVGALQYSSTHWKALKFKYEITEDSRCASSTRDSTYITFFYFNGNDKAYYLVEYNDNQSDMDTFLRKIQL